MTTFIDGDEPKAPVTEKPPVEETKEEGTETT